MSKLSKWLEVFSKEYKERKIKDKLHNLLMQDSVKKFLVPKLGRVIYSLSHILVSWFHAEQGSITAQNCGDFAGLVYDDLVNKWL